MKRYEEILSKIAPIFHKFIQYQSYFIPYLISSYLQRANVPETLELGYLPKNSHYLFYIRGIHYLKISSFLEGKTSTNILVMLITKKKIPLDFRYIVIDIDEFLIDEILNKFNSLNSYTEKVLIALLGKDTYDTIRRNIK
jgi:hypothetical protein